MTEIEQAVGAFMRAWERRDWPRMVRALQVRRRTRTTSQRLRAQFVDLEIRRWAIAGEPRIKSVARVVTLDGGRLGITPDAREVSVDILYRYAGSLLRQRLEIIVVREDEKGQPPLEDEAGTWGVNEISALRGRHASGGQYVPPEEAANDDPVA